MGRKAREWTIEYFSVETVGKFIEDFIDNAPETNYDFSTKEEERNPYFQIPEIKDVWVKFWTYFNDTWLKSYDINTWNIHHINLFYSESTPIPKNTPKAFFLIIRDFLTLIF
jgi:hypothetical protein